MPACPQGHESEDPDWCDVCGLALAPPPPPAPASGPVPPIDPQLLNEAGSVFLTRPSIKDWTSRPGELQSRVQAVVGMVANGSVKFRIGGTFPLSEARTAHEQLQARKTTGSLVLIP